MDKVKELLEEINKYPKDKIIFDSAYYDLLVQLIDEYWKIRKNYKYGDKVIGIIFYHDFIDAAVMCRNHCYYINGKYDKYKEKTDIFPNWDKFIDDCRNYIIEDQRILNDGIKNLNEFVKLEYLPSFNGFYRKQYLQFIINHDTKDYEVDLNFYKITDDFSKELYNYIKDNPLTFLDEIRKK